MSIRRGHDPSQPPADKWLPRIALAFFGQFLLAGMVCLLLDAVTGHTARSTMLWRVFQVISWIALGISGLTLLIWILMTQAAEVFWKSVMSTARMPALDDTELMVGA